MTYKKWSDEQIKKMIKNGYGSGVEKEYKPWIHIKDVPSEGLSHRPLGWKTKRKHQFLSQLEFEAFLPFEWSDVVIDIREQYPIDRNETVSIAEKLAIRHPVYKGTDINVVMTTDILLTVKAENGNKLLARSIKPANNLADLRTIEKLELERSFWQGKGIDWGIITDKDINKTFTNNLRWLHNYKHSTVFEFSEETTMKLVNLLCSYLRKSNDTFLVCLDHFDYEYNLPKGSAISLLRHIIASKILKVRDMFAPIDLTKRIESILSFDEVV